MAEYINREDLVERIEMIDWYHENEYGHLIHGGTSKMETYLPTKDVERAIKSVPIADVVSRKKGTWLELDSCMTVCSECNSLGCGTKYCANCGAKMEV